MKRAFAIGLLSLPLTVPAPAADRPAAEPPQFLLYDGPSGVSRDHWNRGIALRWQHPLGDWRDAAGEPQGAKPFATLAVKPADATKRVEIDVTALAREWTKSGNTGALLRAAGGSAEFASREGDAAQRPLLIVTTDRGKFTCPPTADATLASSTFKPLGEQPTLVVTKPGTSAVLRFDLAAVDGTPTAATLALTVNKAADPASIDVMRLDAPAVGVIGKPIPGLAKDFPRDNGIVAHKDVIVATDFGDGWQKYFGGTIRNPAFARDDALGSTYIRGQFTKGEVGSASLEYRFSSRKEPEPEEAYFRYYVYLEDDWGSLVDGNKMPGLAGRYGVWNGRLWNPTAGNGGARTTGLVTMTPRGENRSGWSMRTTTHAKPPDENPYREWTAVQTYAYHADQAGHFGDGWRWGGTLLAKNRWYCIEQYAKLNSIDGPLDDLGNGTGKKDGVFRAWVDGVPVLEKTNVRFRHNAKIKIDEVWLNWYHGGTKPAAAEHHYRMSNVVVARSYIGPMAPQEK